MPVIVAIETLTDLYLNLAKKYKNSDKTAFAFNPAPNSGYKSVTWDAVNQDRNTVTSYLTDQGVEKGDRIAILSENRYEWAVVDLAIQITEAINVSLYTSLLSNLSENFLQDSEVEKFYIYRKSAKKGRGNF